MFRVGWSRSGGRSEICLELIGLDQLRVGLDQLV